MVKNLPTMWETWVQSLGWEDPLEEGMAIHSSILAWKIPMDRGGWWATVHGFTKSPTCLTKHRLLVDDSILWSLLRELGKKVLVEWNCSHSF